MKKIILALVIFTSCSRDIDTSPTLLQENIKIKTTIEDNFDPFIKDNNTLTSKTSSTNGWSQFQNLTAPNGNKLVYYGTNATFSSNNGERNRKQTVLVLSIFPTGLLSHFSIRHLDVKYKKLRISGDFQAYMSLVNNVQYNGSTFRHLIGNVINGILQTTSNYSWLNNFIDTNENQWDDVSETILTSLGWYLEENQYVKNDNSIGFESGHDIELPYYIVDADENYANVYDVISAAPRNIVALNERPNIVLIMTDDQGYGDAGFTGHPDILTPNLDRLANAGVILDRFYAPAPSCAPSRTSFMIGRHHERTGVLSHKVNGMRFSEITLAEMVAERGYTSGVFGKWHLGLMDRNDQHPGHNMMYGPPVLHGFDTQFTTTGSIWEWTPSRYWTGENEYVEDDVFARRGDSEIMTDEALDFIDENQDQPFMAVVWYHVPHTPLVTGGGIQRPYRGSGFSNEQRKYYSLITDMDRHIGRIADKLEELGLDEDTIIMFSSDNGPAPSPSAGPYMGPRQDPGLTGGLRGRKGTLYEGGIKSPAFVKWPRHITPGTRSSVPMGTIDYFPTLAHIIGVDINQYNVEYDGENIFNNLTGEYSNRQSDMFFRYSKHHNEPRSKALIRGDFKLISQPNGNWELYNITQDPLESFNLHSDPNYSTLIEEMTQSWETKSESVTNSFNNR